ncbi:hypothetical protein BCD49_37980 [Pseudofrankia sp. EUN1h]|nr:hypothetical protein BCD49_37980 [Pseudofrankia sp. EUN1h]
MCLAQVGMCDGLDLLSDSERCSWLAGAACPPGDVEAGSKRLGITLTEGRGRICGDLLGEYQGGSGVALCCIALCVSLG